MKTWIVVASLALAGAALPAATLCAAEAATTEKAEAVEVKVKLEDCPKAVQETIKKEVGDGKVEKIEKETKDGKTVYEVDAEINGKDYEIVVAEDGTLISKKLEADDKEEGGAEQKGQHEDEK